MAQYIISKSLQADIDYIKRRADNIKKSSYEIAWKLYSIVQSPDFADSGYRNIVDLAADHFGFARSTTLNYVAIANKYLTTEFSGGKDKVITTTRARIGEDGKVSQDYAIGQLNALGKTTGDDFKAMDEKGIINPDMSADKIKEAVKKWYAPEQEPEPETDPEPEQEPDEQAEEDKTYTHTLAELVQCLCRDIIGDDYNFDTDCALDSAMQFLTNREYRLQINCRTEDDEKFVETVNVLHAGSDRVVLTYPAIVSE
jgi:hypothetical protein